MKYIVSVLITVCSWLPLPTYAGESVIVMSDPILGLDFNFKSSSIDTVPAKIVKALHMRKGQYWIFATYDDTSQSGSRYMIISGLAHMKLDTKPSKMGGVEPDFGAVIVERAGKYKALGVPDRMLSGDLKLNDRVIRGLVHDAITRLIRIFGSRDSLQDEIKKQWKGEADFQPMVRDALQQEGISEN